MIYIVSGETGEYSDREEWLVRAFTKEADAYDFRDRVEARYHELAKAAGGAVRLAWKRPDGYGNELDPWMQVQSCTGVEYSVEAVPLDEEKPCQS